MRTPALEITDNEFEVSRRDERPDLVAAYLASRETDRCLTVIAGCLAIVLLAFVVIKGYEVTRPVPDATFAFRV